MKTLGSKMHYLFITRDITIFEKQKIELGKLNEEIKETKQKLISEQNVARAFINLNTNHNFIIIMTNTKNSVLIALSVTVAVSLGIVTIQITTADQSDNLIADFRSDIRDLVRSGDYTWEEALEIRKIHDKELDDLITESEIQTNETVTGKYRESAKDYILHEELKRQHRLLNDEHTLDTAFGNEIETNDPELMGFSFPSAHADCDDQPKVMFFRQSKIDINGGMYGIHNFEGSNILESVQRTTLDDCRVEYTLTFQDEDHPFSDKFYDYLRLNVLYGSIHDVETFYVQNGDDISYHNIWSDGKSYDYTFYGFGQHADHVGDFGRVVYVANTWNHSMDTENTNPDLKQKLHRFR